MNERFLKQIYPFDQQLIERSLLDTRLFAALWVPLIGFFVSFAGLIVLLGWVAGIEALTRISPDLASMKPNTALAFVLAGGALGLNSKIFPAYQFRPIQIVLCAGTFLLAFIDLVLSVFDPGETLTFSVINVTATGESGARMSLMTEISFIIISTALALLLFYRQRTAALAGGLGIAVLLIAFFALAAYALDATALYALKPFESMALHTAVLFLVVSLGLLGVVLAANFHVIPRLDSALMRNALVIWFVVMAFEFLSARAIVQVSDELPSEFATLLNVRTLVAIVVSAGLIYAAVALLAIKNKTQIRLEANLRKNEELLDSITNSTAEGIYGIDSKGNCNFVNQSCLELLGFSSRTELLGKNMHDLVHHTHPDGSQSPLQECPIYQSLLSSDRIHVDDDVFWRKDGSMLPVEYWSYPLLRDGEVTGSVVTFVNITERKKAEETRQLLMREVNHRANNLLAIVQSIARQTANQKSGEEFSITLQQRLQSLAASQDLIIRGDWRSVTLKSLVAKQFSVLGMAEKDRIEASGPQVLLSPQAAQAIGMAFHELATNSIKYGALSNKNGKVHVTWRMFDENGSESLEVKWREENGPLVKKPNRTGFGSVVIERLAAGTVDGNVDLNYKKEGLVWRLTCPQKSAIEHNSL